MGLLTMKKTLILALIGWAGFGAVVAHATDFSWDRDYAVVLFVSTADAVPGDKVIVTIEVYNLTLRTLSVPDPKAMTLRYDHFSTGLKQLASGNASLASAGSVDLRPRSKTSAEMTFVVPECSGLLVIRAGEFPSVGAALRVHGRDEGAWDRESAPVVVEPAHEVGFPANGK